MRIDRKTLTLIIASLCGTGSSAVTMGQEYSNSSPASSVGRIGDGVAGATPSSVSESVGIGANASAFGSRLSDEVGVTGALPVSTSGSFYDPAKQSVPATPVAFDTGSYVESSVGSSCSSGCNSCGVGPLQQAGLSSGWLESETLLWWGRGQTGAPTVVGGNSPTVLPTTVLAGGNSNPVGTNLLLGQRVDLGLWLDDCQSVGVGARGFGILTNGTTNTITNGGNSTGVSFFNTTIGLPDTYLVNFSTGPNSTNTGTIGLRTDTDLIAGELYTKMLLARDGSARTDLLSGYTFLRLDNELGIATSFTDGITNPIQNGTVFTTNDTFSTKNTFHGGHLGLSNEINRGRFSFSLLGKVALGNMQSRATIAGRYTETPPNAATVTENRGLFAQSSNIGTLSQNRFTFLPEAGAKIKYQLGRAQFGVGYTLLVLPSVAMASGQVDRNIDIGGIGGVPAAPLPRFSTETFFLHGVDLGMTIKF